MSIFTDTLIISPLHDGSHWVIRKDFSYDVGKEGSGDTISVPAGFVTDFTSIPRFLWSVFPKWGIYGNAAIVHDYLYYTNERSQEEADDIFYEGMLVLGTNQFVANCFYRSVKMFGKDSYEQHTKQSMIKPLNEKIEIYVMEI